MDTEKDIMSETRKKRIIFLNSFQLRKFNHKFV